MLRDKLRVQKQVHKQLKRMHYNVQDSQEERLPLKITLPVAVVVSGILWFLLFRGYEFAVSFGSLALQEFSNLFLR